MAFLESLATSVSTFLVASAAVALQWVLPVTPPTPTTILTTTVATTTEFVVVKPPVAEPYMVETGVQVVSSPVPDTPFYQLQDTRALENTIDDRFVGLLAHVRWLYTQQQPDSFYVKRVDRLERQVFSFMDDVSDSFNERDGQTTIITGTSTVDLSLLTGSTLVGPIFSGAIASNLSLGSNWLSGDGDNEGIRVTSNGNVGIGFSSPNRSLSVNGDVYISGNLRDGGDAAGVNGMVLLATGTSTRWVATSTLGLGGSGGGLFVSDIDTSIELSAVLTDETGAGLAVFNDSPTLIGTTTVSALTLSALLSLSGSSSNIALGSNYLSGDGDDEGIRISNNGYVSIGTALELAPLSLVTGNATTAMMIGNNTSDARIVFSNNIFTNFASLGILNGGLALSGSPDISTASHIYINDSGNVGFGTTSPLTRIDVVASGTAASIMARRTDGSGMRLGVTTSEAAVLFDGTLPLNFRAPTRANLESNTVLTGPIRMTIATSGSIGIGTTSPSSLFAVAGTMTVTATSTLSTTTVTDIVIARALRDAANSAGANGSILRSTGTSTAWFATSTLGIALADTTGTLAATRGGTGLSTVINNQLLIGGPGNTWTQISTSSLGIVSGVSFTNSSELAALLNDETGTGLAVFNASPTFTGTATFGDILGSNATITSATTTNLAVSSLTSGRIPFITTGGRLIDSANLTFDGSRLSTFNLDVTGTSTFVGTSTFSGRVGIGTATIATGTRLTLAGGGISADSPTAPTLVGTYDTSGLAYGLSVVGRYAYVADNASGLQIIDISDPAAPILVSTFDTSGGAHAVSIVGRYAYVADASTGLQIIDISNPASPTLVSTFDTGLALDVSVVGRYAYVADQADGLRIIDISNPAAPTLTGTYDTSGGAGMVSVVGRYAYVADSASGLQIIDISNPASTTLVGTLDTVGTASGVYVVGRYAYVADNTSGLQIIDISNPASPVLVGTIDTSGASLDVMVVGRYAYVADNTSGLLIIDINGSEFSSLFAGALGATEGNIVNELVVGNNGTFGGGLNVGSDARIAGSLTITGTASSSLLANGTHTALTVMSGRVGIGTTSPSSFLTVAGTANITGTSTLATTTIGDLTITAALRDTIGSAGTSGMVLQSTGTSTRWVATSSLGFGSGGGGVTTFLDLTDTPDTFTANRVLFTNASGTSLVDNNNFQYSSSSQLLTLSGNLGTGYGLSINGVGQIFGTDVLGGQDLVVGALGNQNRIILTDLDDTSFEMSMGNGIVTITAATSTTINSLLNVTGDVDFAGGFVAMGTTTLATTTFTGESRFAARVGIGTTTPSSDARLTLYATGSEQTLRSIARNILDNDTRTGATFSITAEPGDVTTGTSYVRGITNQIDLTDLTVVGSGVTEVYGSYTTIQDAGTINIANERTLYGASTIISASSTGVSSAVGSQVVTYDPAEAVGYLAANYGPLSQTTNAIGFRAAGSSLNNYYGFYVQDDGGANLNSYAFYAEGNMRSYFGGNVGIGTTTPGSKLSVAGNAYIDGTITTTGGINVTGGATFGNISSASVSVTNATSTNVAISSLTTGRVPFITTGGRLTDSTNFTFDGSRLSTLNLNVTGTSTFLGTTTLATTTLTGNLLPATTLTLDIGTSTNRFRNIWAETLNVGTSTWSIFNGANGRLAFSNAALQGGTEALSILDNGNVGVGTTTPGSRLTVAGNVLLSGSFPYISFGNVSGAMGYGLRNKNGNIQVKNLNGRWASINGSLTDTSVIQSYDPSFASYLGVALSLVDQDTSPRDIEFNDDGTVLYMLGQTGDDINKYNLSIPYDISTAVFSSVALSVAAEETAPSDVLFNNNGTVLYVSGTSGDDINKYNLSIPYDISTAVFDSVALSVAATQTFPVAMLYNGDGSKLFVLGSTPDTIDSYNLSTPYDISSATFATTTLDVSFEESSPRAMKYNVDGTKLFVIGTSDFEVNVYSLATPYEIGTATFSDIALVVGDQDDVPVSMLFNDQGTSLYIIGQTNDNIYEYSMIASSSIFVTDKNARFGIGTNNPDARLTVAGGGVSANMPTKPVFVGSTTQYVERIRVMGRYAYATADTLGFQVIDISNPANPTIVNTFDTTGNADELDISGNYAYIADGPSGLQILDISNPATTTFVGTFNTSGYARDVYVTGRYAYVADDTAGLLIIDVSNPFNPILIGTYNTAGLAYGVQVIGRYAYVADDTAGLQIIDISRPTAPALLRTVNTPGFAVKVDVIGRYAYVADVSSGLQIIDISNPATATTTGGLFLFNSAAYDLQVSGRYAYVADAVRGLQIIDISSSSNPILLAENDTLGAPFGIELAGRYAYISDFYGLIIVDVNGSEFSSLFAGAVDATDVNIVSNLTVGDSGLFRGFLEVGNDTAIGGSLVISGVASSSLLSSGTHTSLAVLSGNVGIGSSSPSPARSGT